MDSTSTPAYGLWSLVIINSFIFIIFAFSFAKPQSQRDWRSFGAFSGFLVALFTEMYGFPLTIYLLSGWLSTRFPGIDWLSHDAGHLLETLFGWRGNPHFGPFHLLSSAFLVCGFWLLAAAWKVLFEARRAAGAVSVGEWRSSEDEDPLGELQCRSRAHPAEPGADQETGREKAFPADSSAGLRAAGKAGYFYPDVLYLRTTFC